MKNKPNLAPYQIQILQGDKKIEISSDKDYFQILYILEGSGFQWFRELKMPYSQGDLFILSTTENSIFNVEKSTNYLLIRFTCNYMSFGKENLDSCYFFKKIENRLKYYNSTQGAINQNSKDRALIDLCAQKIAQETGKNHFFSDTIIRSALILMLCTVTQTLDAKILLQLKNIKENEKIFKIVTYIQGHIYENEKLTILHLSTIFHISPHYFSEYFKKNIGQALKEFILGYKINLTQQRLTQNMPMPLIVDELGFTDESHLNRTFKKYKGETIRVFRKKLK